RGSFDKPTHIAQTEEPWSHLHSCATVASSQRGAAQGHGVSCPPSGLRSALQLTLCLFLVFKNSGDSLDFQLQAIYDHSKDFFWTKSQMLYQRESVSEGPRWASDTCRHINARSLRISADAF
ncbi:unnamed protein product, partial [Tetraodon nigroviridis]